MFLASPAWARIALAPALTEEAFRRLLSAAGRSQLKGVLRDQQRIAGIGNAYSDEILHAARLSPFKPADSLSGADVARLYEAMRTRCCRPPRSGHGARRWTSLKDDKRTHLRVHNKAGSPCPVCADTIREVSFADSALQYCPTCQTGGKPLADRRMSRLLK